MEKLKQLIEQTERDLDIYKKIVEEKQKVLDALKYQLELEEIPEGDVPF